MILLWLHLHNTDALLANTMVLFKCHQYQAPKIPLANTGNNLSYYLYCEISQSDSRTPVNTYQLLLYSMSVVSLNWEMLPCYLIYLLYDLQRGCLYSQHSIFVFIWLSQVNRVMPLQYTCISKDAWCGLLVLSDMQMIVVMGLAKWLFTSLGCTRTLITPLFVCWRTFKTVDMWHFNCPIL
jgi:hypothetical protein